VRTIERHLRIFPYRRPTAGTRKNEVLQEIDAYAPEHQVTAETINAMLKRHGHDLRCYDTVPRGLSYIDILVLKEIEGWAWIDPRDDERGEEYVHVSERRFYTALRTVLRRPRVHRALRRLGAQWIDDHLKESIVDDLLPTMRIDRQFIDTLRDACRDTEQRYVDVRIAWNVAHSCLRHLDADVLSALFGVNGGRALLKRLPSPKNAEKIARAARVFRLGDEDSWVLEHVLPHSRVLQRLGDMRLSDIWRGRIANERVLSGGIRRASVEDFWTTFRALGGLSTEALLREAPARFVGPMWANLLGVESTGYGRLRVPEKSEADKQGIGDLYRRVVSRKTLLECFDAANGLDERIVIRLVQLLGKQAPRLLRMVEGLPYPTRGEWEKAVRTILSTGTEEEAGALLKHIATTGFPKKVSALMVIEGYPLLGAEERALPPSVVLDTILRHENAWLGEEGVPMVRLLSAMPEYSDRERIRAITTRWLMASKVDLLPVDSKITIGKYTIRILPKSDPRGLLLGELTNCCQHPGGAGDSCAWHGVEDPNHGFIVVEDDNGDVIAQSWIWHDPEQGGVCIDSIESRGLSGRADTVKELYWRFAEEILMPLYGQVFVGRTYKLLTEEVGERLKYLRPPSGYSDAREQRLMCGEGLACPLYAKKGIKTEE
jgi:hypothetical protein